MSSRISSERSYLPTNENISPSLDEISYLSHLTEIMLTYIKQWEFFYTLHTGEYFAIEKMMDKQLFTIESANNAHQLLLEKFETAAIFFVNQGNLQPGLLNEKVFHIALTIFFGFRYFYALRSSIKSRENYSESERFSHLEDSCCHYLSYSILWLLLREKIDPNDRYGKWYAGWDNLTKHFKGTMLPEKIKQKFKQYNTLLEENKILEIFQPDLMKIDTSQ